MMDKQKQRQVWQRVYQNPPPPPAPPIPRDGLLQSQRRLQQNLRFYQMHAHHSIYGPAFSHLIRQTQEQIQMLQQMMDPPPPR